MIVDEDRMFHLGSDHNMLITSINFNSAKLRSNDHKKSTDQTPCHWNISKDHNWSPYQSALEKGFRNWNPADFQDVNLLWNNWKSNLISIASDVIGSLEFIGSLVIGVLMKRV